MFICPLTLINNHCRSSIVGGVYSFIMAGAASGSSKVVVQIVNSQRVVCPTQEELEIESGEHVCPSEGCGRAFQTSSHLKMHVSRHHLGEKLSSVGRTSTTGCVYYCPVEACPRSKGTDKPFPRLGQLKQVGK